MIKFFKLDCYEYLLWDIYNIIQYYVKHQGWIFLYSQVGIVYSVPNLSTYISKSSLSTNAVLLSQRLTLIWLAHLRPRPHNSGLKNNQLVSTRWNIALKKIWVFRYHIYTPSGNYMFKVNNKNTKTRCEILLKLTIKTPEQRQWSNTLKKFVGKIADELFWVFLTNGVVLVSLLLPLNTFHTLF